MKLRVRQDAKPYCVLEQLADHGCKGEKQYVIVIADVPYDIHAVGSDDDVIVVAGAPFIFGKGNYGRAIDHTLYDERSSIFKAADVEIIS